MSKSQLHYLFHISDCYPYISLNKKHEFPGFKFFRGKPSKDGQYFGPYTHVVNVRKILSILQKTFLVRLCEDSYYKTRKKPCLQYQIKRCSAPCVGYISKDDYSKSIISATMFLKGETVTMTDDLFDMPGGRKQRIGLARAFYKSPNFLVLDEPTSSLDAEFESKFLSLIKEHKERGATIIINTHNKRILTMSDYILAIKDGRQKLFDSKENIKKKMKLPL